MWVGGVGLRRAECEGFAKRVAAGWAVASRTVSGRRCAGCWHRVGGKLSTGARVGALLDRSQQGKCSQRFSQRGEELQKEGGLCDGMMGVAWELRVECDSRGRGEGGLRYIHLEWCGVRMCQSVFGSV